jgi:hypothetical protein
MDIPWPLNTKFNIRSQDGDDTWIVSNDSDTKNGVISEKTPLGKSLLLSGEQRYCSFITPDNRLCKFTIIGIKPPGYDENVFSSPIEYYLDRYRSDSRGIRNNPYMSNMCLDCGHQNSPTLPGIKICEVCNTFWYRNHCWKCTKGQLDSRDHKTPRCPKCRYWICADCGACYCGSGFLWKSHY